MLIKKDDLLEVFHTRKGKFVGVATRNFDTEKATTEEVITGMANDWVEGEEIPCRASLCTIKKFKRMIRIRRSKGGER